MANAARTTTRRSRRTWTDEQLAVAVRGAHSWRGVLRNLGLYPGGPNLVVKREAARLGLDTTHFGSPLRCSDAELTAALTSEDSWPSLLAALGMHIHSRRCRAAVTARAAYLGLRTAHLDLPRKQSVAADGRGELTPDLAYLRRAAEPLAAAWFTLRGLWPAVPAEPRPYDLLVETPSHVRRVQVKTTTSRAGSGSWCVGISRHSGGGRKHDKKMPYAVGEIDHFVIIDGDLTVYLIPLAAVADRRGICLNRYSAFVVGSAASIALPADAHTAPLYRPSAQARKHESAAQAAGLEVQPSRCPPPAQQPRQADRQQPEDPPTDGAAADRDNRWATRWPESQLRAAAKRATSWADMLREFGFKPSSTKPRAALQRQIRQFGIDTSHFVGKRTWSDKALTDAAATARSWAELAGALGLSTSTGHYESIRAAAQRLGVNLEHLTRGPTIGREALGIEIPDEVRLGSLTAAAPLIATAWFLLRGAAVSAPAQPEPYDLVVQLPDRLTKVQVKTTVFRDRRGSWCVRIGHRPDGLPTAADFVAYGAEEVDLFFVIDGDLLLYLIPRSAVAGRKVLSLRRYTEFIVGDASSLLESRNPASPTIPRPEAA